MNQDTSSYQECRFCDDVTKSDDEDIVKVHKRRDANKDFDLPQNYHNAVHCLVQCEYLIKTLQEQLVSKDRQIVSLEEKLVRMSFELASSKAVQDEQLHRFKRKISSIVNSSVNGEDECTALPSRQQQQQTARKVQEGQAAVNYAPVSFSRIRNSPRLHNSRPVLSRSPSARDGWQSYKVDTTAWPQAINEKHDPSLPVDGRDPEPRQSGGFSLSRLAQRMSSWNTSSWSTMDAKSSTTLDISAKESIFSSTSSGSIRNHTAGSEYRSKGIITSDSSRSSTSTNGMRQSAATLNNGPIAPTRRLVRQHSSIGQLILGLNKNDNTKEEEAANERTMNDEDDPPCRARSSPLEISGVVFPVSSDDCLIGLYQDAVIESSPSRSRCSSVNANAEWPEFQ